jgi:hypothetical protein
MHLPILTSKLDLFAWDKGVTSLLCTHGLLGHILDSTEPLDVLQPDRISKTLPILPATPTSQDLQDLTHWWDDNNAAQHVLTSQIQWLKKMSQCLHDLERSDWCNLLT